MGCFQNVEIKIADEEIPDKAGSLSSRCNVKIQQNIWLFNISHKTLLIVQYWTELIRQLPIVQIAAFLMIMMIIVTSSLFQYFEFVNCQPKDLMGDTYKLSSKILLESLDISAETISLVK